MKKSTNRSLKQKRNNFSTVFDTREDGFVLADLQVFPDDTGLTITPLNHIIDNEDAIDRLLLNSGFDTITAPEQTEKQAAVLPVDEPIHPFTAVTEMNAHQDDALTVEAIDTEPWLNKTEIISNFEPSITPFNHFVDGEDALDRLLLNTGFDIAAKEAQTEEQAAAPKTGQISAVAEMDAHKNSAMTEAIDKIPPRQETPAKLDPDFQVSAFISDYLARQPGQRTDAWKKLPVNAGDQETCPEPVRPEPEFHDALSENTTERMTNNLNVINNNHSVDSLYQITAELEGIKKQLKKNAVSKSASINYAALILSVLTLMATAVLYNSLSDMKTNLLKLTGQVEILKDDVEINDSKPLPEPSKARKTIAR